jgi:hypothetical protein
MDQPSKITYVPEAEYLKSLQDFGEHTKASVAEMLDIIYNDGEYENRFNIKIEVNGKSTTIEMHADAFDRLMTMLEAEMTEYIEIHGGSVDA